MSDFKVGDRVRYELSWWGKPRWVGNNDRGGSGHWEDGVVVEVRATSWSMVVEGRTGRSNWPLEDHINYDLLQWSWPGYLTKTGESSQKKQEVKCDCGSHATYGTDCALHSNWCSLSAQGA